MRSHRESCWYRYPATPEDTRASPSTRDTAGCCTAGTRTTTRAPWTDIQVPGPIKAIEPLLAFDRKKVRDNHARLTELYRRQEPDLLMVCAHDATCSNTQRRRRSHARRRHHQAR